MLEEDVKKPSLHVVLDQIASQVCFIKLNIDLNEKHAISELIDAALENKIKEFGETISAYECDRFMSMSIPVVFLTPISSDLLPSIDAYFKSKNYVFHNRVVVKFTRIQPEFPLEIEDRPNTLSRNSLFFNNKKSIEVLPAIQECVEPESKPIKDMFDIKPIESDVTLESERSSRHLSQSRSSSRSSSLSPSLSSSRTPSPIRKSDFPPSNQSEFFKSSDSGKNKSDKNFSLPTFGIFKKHKNADKKVKHFPPVPMSIKLR